MTNQFLDAVFADGLQHPNFFNGRILTATDLRDEQAAGLKRSRYLGQAVGTGVVHGLAVSAVNGQRDLQITAGLAVNPRGDGLALPGTTTVELVLTEPLGNPTSPFVPCDIAGATKLTGKVSTGYYLLAIASATRLSTTMAPNSGLAGDRPGCTHRYEEVGVQFKLIPLTNDDFVVPPGNAPNTRSRLAHRCLGTDQIIGFAADPVHAPTTYGLLDELRADQRLTPCDVPLAVFRFQPPTVRFVDMWAVRRPCFPNGGDESWLDADPALVGYRRLMEARAFLRQFQQQLADLRASGDVGIRASQVFDYLPAAGYLPTGIGSTPGFSVSTFFADTDLRHVALDPTQLRALFQRSFAVDPMRPGVDAIDIYPVLAATGQEPYVVFMRRGLSLSGTTSGGTCTYTLNPDNWEASLTQIANGVADIHICLQPGNYALTRPLLIQNKGHVKVTGSGLGTRLLASNAEAALRFDNCQSVIVRDLYAENSTASFPQNARLQGTLSFYDCPQVTVEETSVKCTGGSRKNAACITVSPRKVGSHRLSTVISTVRIQRCNLEVGDRQIGLLLVNTRYAQVDNNHLLATSPQNPAAQGIVVGGTIAADVRIVNNSLHNMLQGIHVGVSHHETSQGIPDRIGTLLILGNTVHIAFPNVSGRIVKERHGIFVGNCDSFVIENNFLSLRRFTSTANSSIDGIRIFGFLGRRQVIRQNHLAAATSFGGFSREGIQITNLSDPTFPPLQENNFIE
jgi:hypothetical protein